MIGQFLLVILLLLSGVYIFKLSEKKESLKRRLVRYESIISQEEYQQELDDKVAAQHGQVVYLEEQYNALLRKIDDIKKEHQQDLDDKVAAQHNQVVYLEEQHNAFLRKIDEIKKELGAYEETLELQSFGFYEPKYNFIYSEDYVTQLKSLKLQQSQMISGDLAVECSTEWVIGKSKKEGDKLVKNFKKLILTIFNTECNAIIQKVKPGKVESSQSKIENKFKSLNQSAKVIRCRIIDDYLTLKTHELHLQYELECKKQEEQELSQQIQKETKNRQKLVKIEESIRKAEELEMKYQQEIDEIRQQSYQAAISQKEESNRKIEMLEIELQKAQKDRESAESQFRRVKSGHVYIISNIGSFGRDVYRICATKSIDETSYISVMNPVVPFPFDIHYKFFSEDVSETLRLLHDRFENKRVNKVNARREFFDVSMDEIVIAIGEIRKKTDALKNFSIEEKAPTAYEFRKTQQIQRGLQEKEKSA